MRDSQINNLELQVMELTRSKNKLLRENSQLKTKLAQALQKINSMEGDGAISNFQICHVMEKQLQSLTEQVIALQKINQEFQQTIINLQTQNVKYERQLNIKDFQLQSLMSKCTQQLGGSTKEPSTDLFISKLDTTCKEKLLLIEQNIQLQQEVKDIKLSAHDMMQKYLNQLTNVSNEIQNQESSSQKEIHAMFEQFKQYNEKLRSTIEQKDKQLAKMGQMLEIPSSQHNYLHTIQNLQKELKRKSQFISDFMERLKKTQDLKKKFTEFDELYLRSTGQLKNLTERYDQLTIENQRLKCQIKNQQQNRLGLEKQLKEEDQKKYELLIENQACHELLYRLKGFSYLYKEDLREQIQICLKNLEARKELEKWTDINELIEINRKLRLRIK